MWYIRKKINQANSKEISADIQVPRDSTWFSGHFPGDPILPGIAQLGMVFDAIHQLGNRNIKISNINRVRFKQIIRPDDHLEIIIVPRENYAESYSFRIMVGGKLVCSGVMTVESGTHNKRKGSAGSST